MPLKEAHNLLGHPAEGKEHDREQIELETNSFIDFASVFSLKHVVLCKILSLGLYSECFPAMAKTLGLEPPTILVRDNDMKFTPEFDETLKREGVDAYPLPLRAPLMNAHG